MTAASSRITYAVRPDTTPETEAAALAAVYRFLLDQHAKKKAAPTSGPDARKEISNDSGKSILR